jgi:hypothetical protein
MKKKIEETTTLSDLEHARLALKMLVRSRDDFQGIRKNMDNRLGRKASGEDQEVEKNRALAEYHELANYAAVAREQEKLLEKDMLKQLKRFPVYNEFLVKVKGVGPVSAGWIIAEFNIHIADTVSKLWQFSGMNPGMVRGKKRVEKKDSYSFVVTDKMVRGDKRTPGFVAPFNGRLRVALLGVMADGFIKAQNSYAMDYYYPYKNRKENSASEVLHWKSKGKPAAMVPWKDVSKGHRDSAAKRYMIKAFLKDLYVAWRTVEGLPVREPYAEEYLGKKHAVAPKKGKGLKLIK